MAAEPVAPPGPETAAGVPGPNGRTPEPVHRDDARRLLIYQADCLGVLDALAAESPTGRFDCVFADPPYFLSNGGSTCSSGRRVKVDKGTWDKSRGVEENHAFNREWLLRCQRLLKPDGTIWVTGTNHVIFSIGFAMQQLGFKILNDIAWEKPNPPPNLSCRYFTHSTETVLWAARTKESRHVFHYQEMRKVRGKQMKTVWRREEFQDDTAPPDSLWTMTAPRSEEKSLGKHPAQKPVALVERCLLASTNEGDWVLDPFLGSGTTAVACLRNGRGCVGIEIDPEQARLSVRRLAVEAASAPPVANGGG